MNIKELFEKAENGTLTYEQFEAAAKESGAKFADLSAGTYVSKSKYESDLKAKDAQMDTLNEQIENLNNTIATRDADRADLQKKLEAAGNDATKLAELTSQFDSLQSKYDADVQAYQNKMKQQSYEFAVREFANSKKFTSQAAKRDFTSAMIAKNLQMDGGKIIGGEDFVSLYSVENADAFVVEKPAEPTPPVEKPVEPPKAVPTIVAPTPGLPASGNGAGETPFQFNFTGVRSH